MASARASGDALALTAALVQGFFAGMRPTAIAQALLGPLPGVAEAVNLFREAM